MRPRLFVGLSLFALALSACGKGDKIVPAPTDTATPRPHFNLTVESEDYFELFPFHLEWVPKTMEEYPSPNDDFKYREAVLKLRAGGMQALTDDERRMVIAVTWYARVMLAHTVRYQEENRDEEGNVISLWETEDRYEFKGTPDAPSPYPFASHSTPIVREEGMLGGEVRSSYEIVDDKGEEDALVTFYVKVFGVWSCSRYRASGPNASILVRPTLPDGFARGKYVGEEEVNGRPAYKLEAGVSHGIFPRPEYVWIDVDTLLPVREQYDEGGGEVTTKTILEINGDVSIDLPNIVASCLEQDVGEPQE